MEKSPNPQPDHPMTLRNGTKVEAANALGTMDSGNRDPFLNFYSEFCKQNPKLNANEAERRGIAAWKALPKEKKVRYIEAAYYARLEKRKENISKYGGRKRKRAPSPDSPDEDEDEDEDEDDDDDDDEFEDGRSPSLASSESIMSVQKKVNVGRRGKLFSVKRGWKSPPKKKMRKVVTGKSRSVKQRTRRRR